MLVSAGMLISKCCHAMIVYDGNKYQCAACNKHCESAGTIGQQAAVESEHARLKDEVVKLAKAWQHVEASPLAESIKIDTRARLRRAVTALESFEAEHK